MKSLFVKFFLSLRNLSLLNLIIVSRVFAFQDASEEAVRAWYVQGNPFYPTESINIPSTVNTGHPEGLAVFNNDYYLSLMDEDKTSSKIECKQSRILHFKKFDSSLVLKDEKIISTNERNECHLGGLVWGANYNELWTALAQFKASSSSTMLAINPNDLSIKKELKIMDHIGSQIYTRDALYAFSWDSRKLYKADLCEHDLSKCKVSKISESKARSSAYQDCKTLISDGRPITAFCSGLDFEPWSWNVIGFLRWDLWWKNQKSWEWPLKLERTGYLDWIEIDSKGTHLLGRFNSPKVDGVFLSRNPMAIWEERKDHKFNLNFAFVPDDHPRSKLLIYESGWLEFAPVKESSGMILRNLSGDVDKINSDN
ncbi:MAG: hypothetical protein KA116_02405 [Proteobacteria bacterium]|nr:hypothetical protein [Pseudomonadota bacterium]